MAAEFLCKEPIGYYLTFCVKEKKVKFKLNRRKGFWDFSFDSRKIGPIELIEICEAIYNNCIESHDEIEVIDYDYQSFFICGKTDISDAVIKWYRGK